jgi:secreted trypsin-like serine protease
MTLKGFSLSLISAALTVAVAIMPATAATAKKNATINSDMIVGGTMAAANKYPWQVRMFYDSTDENGGCGGSLISRQWVLIAAHCVSEFNDSNELVLRQNAYVIGYGSNKLQELKRVDTAMIIPHPGYIPRTNDNDIALIKLASPVEYGDGVASVDLGTPELYQKLVGTKVTVTGWGTVLDTDQFKKANPDVNLPLEFLAPRDLQEVQVPVQDLEKCRANYAEIGSSVPDGQLCAGRNVGGKDSCQGDSGGPLVARDPTSKNGWRQVGVVSWGVGCAEAKKFGVYTRTDYYLDWIKETIANNN